MIGYGNPERAARLRELLAAHDARMTDPHSSALAGSGPTQAPTAYSSSRLMIPPAVGSADFASMVGPLLRQWGHRAVDRRSSVRFDPLPADPAPRTRPPASPDPRAILAALRGDGSTTPAGDQVDPAPDELAGLDHLLSAAEQPGGNPFAAEFATTGLDGYGIPSAGRGPVMLTGRDPAPVTGSARPGVVLLDTAVGRHPWFTGSRAIDNLHVGNDLRLAPLPDPAAGPAVTAAPPTTLDLLGALGSHVGHGTFIAGLLRQGCPAVAVHPVAVMAADGVVAERTLLKGLTAVADRVDAEPEWAQALVLSLGYYLEDQADGTYNTTVKQQLVRLARAGVAVFCAAGNDATERPSYPAAFAVTEPFRSDPDLLPPVSVGAVDGRGRRASFSNAGPWVTACAVGVNLVSTVPTDLDGSGRPGSVYRVGRRLREGVDPDGFRSGFASWSGTSFAAPVLAARYLSEWARRGSPRPVATRRGILRDTLSAAQPPVSSPPLDGS